MLRVYARGGIGDLSGWIRHSHHMVVSFSPVLSLVLVMDV